MNKIIAGMRFLFTRPPRKLRISREIALYVETMLLSGTPPAEIGRAVDKTYGREQFRFFQVPNETNTGWTFGPVDYEIDGLEYINAALHVLGGYHRVVFGHARHGKKWVRVSGSGRWAYNPSHPMVQYISGIGMKAAVPERRK